MAFERKSAFKIATILQPQSGVSYTRLLGGPTSCAMTFRTPQGMARWPCGEISISDHASHPIGHDALALR